jgi:hypothetical protein
MATNARNPHGRSASGSPRIHIAALLTRPGAHRSRKGDA